MKESLKASLEQQWKVEHMQKEQIAALAHDLKTPLTVIQGNVDLISETELDEEQRLYAEYISSSSEQMQLYIRTLIDISRAASGYQLHMEDIDVLSYVEQLRGQIDALCQTKKIGLQMELEHLPDVLSVDKLLLERAIMNVINNALDYSPQDSSIHISIIGGKPHLKITVTDAGPGFSQEDLLHAKEQFYMADYSRSSNLHFGMGLFITKSIVQQHGGQLDLSNSEKTGGAQVTILIPY
ncbi:HAMP domain-containing histidine kinase [Blautia stercoris]|uniref:histidine kinase n=2 Tax=Blautia stercoris TaxID=871664 RepID=A0ABR7PBP5_9FIRM|nr:HAMP domain-containing histidine kinase [Blautia stercoris]